VVHEIAPPLRPFTPTDNFFVTNEGLPATRKKSAAVGDEAEVVIVISDAQFAPIVHVSATEEGVATATVWQVVEPGGKVTQVMVDNAVLADSTTNSKILQLFGNEGIVVPSTEKGRKLAEFMRHYFRQIKHVIPQQKKVVQLGWQDDHSFVAAGMHIRPDATKGAARSSGAARARLALMKKTGTLAGWRAIPDIYKAQNNLGAQYALLQGFASPLMSLSGYSGMLVHLYSPDSGTGKTTICHAMNSIWGHGSHLLLTANDTANARPKIISAHNTLPIAIDEVTNLPGKQISELLFSISQGQEKHRMRADTALNAGGTWSMVAMSTGNESLRGKLAGNHRSDNEAENVRMLELRMPVLAQDSKSSALLRAAIENNTGVAGELYAEWLVMNRACLQSMVRAAEVKWTSALSATASERFWCASLAVTEVACTVANAAGLLDFEWSVISKWITDEMLPHQRAGVKESSDWHGAAHLVDELLEFYQDKTIVEQDGTITDTQAIVVQPNMVMVRRNFGTGEITILCSGVRDYLARMNISLAKWADAAKKYEGYTAEKDKVRITRGMSGGGTLGQSRCWVFTKQTKGLK
jgi:hypothetical protein